MCNNSTCHQCNQPPLCAPNDCSCPVKDLSTDCVLYTGDDLACSGIKSQTILTELIQQLDEFICTKVEEIAQTLVLINIGDGAMVYKGIDLQGRKEIRKINAVGDLVTVTENPNDISISIDESELTTFLQDNQLTYSAENVGLSGEGVYDTTTITGNDRKFSFKKIKSDTLTILSTLHNEISIEQPATASIPALYVNNLYVPTEEDFSAGNTKGYGTLAKPFTDTVTAYAAGVPTISSNTAIQNALDAYVGTGTGYDGTYTGTASKKFPQRFGQKVIVQDNNNVGYTFLGDFNYSNLYLINESLIFSTTSGYLVNLDDNTNFNNLVARVTLENRNLIQVQGNGYLSSGNTVATTTYQTGKTLFLNGGGIFSEDENFASNTKYLLNADPNSNVNGTTGCKNDGNFSINIESCSISSLNNGVIKIGGKCAISLETVIIGTSNPGSTINSSSIMVKQSGGEIRISNSTFYLGGNSMRDVALEFSPSAAFENNTAFRAINTVFTGSADVWFNKTTTYKAAVEMSNSKSLFFGGNQLFDSVNLWEVILYNNTFTYINVDFSKVDFTMGNTISSINTIGNEVIEKLLILPTKQQAYTTLTKGSAFILHRNVAAPDLQPGVEYKVAIPGSPSLGMLGDYFIATGNESGTGFGALIERCVVI